MAVDVVMPKMGESITEGTILEWKKKVGDTVKRDETLLEISTDKVDSEVPSPESGIILEILFKINETVEVGTIIAKIGKPGEKSESPNVEFENKNENLQEISDLNHTSKIPEKNTTEIKRFYSPLVKSIAKKNNIQMDELESISGSGKNNRVNKSDILAYINDKSKIEKPKLVTIPTHLPSEQFLLESESNPINFQGRVEPMGRMRSKIANHMVNSVRTSPHVYSTSEVDVTNLVVLREKYKRKFKSKYGLNLTYTPMIIDVVIRALNDFPLLNTSIKEQNIIYHGNINIGIAVALPDNNLIVPVIKESEEKSFIGLARSTADFANRAKENKLLPDEVFGSTFTITNPGIFGSLFGMGIINQPNVGILSTGAIHKRPVVKESEYGDVIVIRNMMYLTLGYDHRLIDGAYGTRFLSCLVKLIENFDKSRLF